MSFAAVLLAHLLHCMLVHVQVCAGIAGTQPELSARTFEYFVPGYPSGISKGTQFSGRRVLRGRGLRLPPPLWR